MNITELRQETSNAILNAGLDTATQINAIGRFYDPVRCDAIMVYIGQCLQEYYRCKNLISQGNTNVEFIVPPVSEEMYKD
jgi:hypothetical protein